MALIAGLALVRPGGPLEAMWRLNPAAHDAFIEIGAWAVPLMIVVAAACVLAATGLWTGRAWGYRVASGVLVVNLIGDLGNALLRHDLRTLIGVPIGGGLLWYLHRLRRRGHFVVQSP
ncbi:MAG: hypothetical protein ACJ8BF_14760 [Gemmatimonadales bacterium]